MQVKSKSGRSFDLPSPEEDEAIQRGIEADPDTQELSPMQFRQLKLKGRPPAAVTKEKISIRLSPHVVERFRASGPGWQGRMDAALQEWLATHGDPK
ncbi:BrnA antitoxin family protein [Acidithiobacillus acidisediminis]|jgi:uncharacterized protein (DUF4415 family)|uniref:BrnA antitoxin family protein n=1 Tax=Acidithiobacillus TaxID=119977 RepID=UPI00200BF002|nr:BrnA antitoxin family protein [Acidithiobacillus sp. S30A2]